MNPLEVFGLIALGVFLSWAWSDISGSVAGNNQRSRLGALLSWVWENTVVRRRRQKQQRLLAKIESLKEEEAYWEARIAEAEAVEAMANRGRR